MANRKIGQAGLNIIKQFEGCQLTAYQCSAGVWTIGYGHTAGVKKGQTITKEQAEEYLRKDCEKFEKYVNNEAYVPLTEQLSQNQFDALVSFAYNCGQGNLKKLCAGRTLAEIAAALPKYNKAAGKVLAGLTRRRAAEADLFNTPDVDGGYQAGVWYKVLEDIPVRNGYYGETGRYEYLSATLKRACEDNGGFGYVKKGNIICPVEVRTFEDGSTWFMLDETIACLVVGKDGTCCVEKAQ